MFAQNSNLFFESICRKIQLESGIWMDKTTPKKRENTTYNGKKTTFYAVGGNQQTMQLINALNSE